MQKLLDRFAIALSGLCVIHCLLTPLAVVFFPMLIATSGIGEGLHWLLLLFILPTSLLALFMGCLHYRDGLALILGLAGLSQLVVVSFLGTEFLGEAGKQFLTIIGSTALILGHIRNRRVCCQCQLLLLDWRSSR